MIEFDFAARRARVLAALGDRGALLVAAAPELVLGDTELRYQVDPELFWLTGYVEPEAVAVLCPSHVKAPYVLFVRPRDAQRELWTGRRGGVEDALERFRADAAYPIGELADRLPQLVAGADALHARLRTGRPDVDSALFDVLSWSRRRRPRTGAGPQAIIDPGAILDELRLIKDDAELHCMREAARISADVFRETTAVIGAGAGEWQIEASVDGGFRVRGATGPAFPTIVASGPNATVLHHIANDRTIEAGELVLVDAGARHGMYCADMTRTFPVSGTFTAVQRALYETVCRAHDAAIAAVRPGATVADVHEAALAQLVRGMLDLGFLEGDADELLATEDPLGAYYPHRTSHWLGLDVHDVGAYVQHGASRKLAPGMVLTIEPGLYVASDAPGGPAELRGVGIRVEDDVLVTADGAEVLTDAMPAHADDIEALMQ